METQPNLLEQMRLVFLSAAEAIDNSQEPLAEPSLGNPVKKFALRHPNAWDKKLFLARCHAYGFRPFRLPDDPPMVNRVDAPEKFYQEVFWPDFHGRVKQLAKLIEALVAEMVPAGGPWDHELELPS
jgi:hypothetical protein